MNSPLDEHQIQPGRCYRTATNQIARPVSKHRNGWTSYTWDPASKQWSEASILLPSQIFVQEVDDPQEAQQQ